MTEAITPVHAAYLPHTQVRKEHEHQGRRVIDTQRLLQSLGDPLLGCTTIDGHQYFVRQMKNMKASMPVSLMTGKPFDFWAFTCGALLARAHARCGDAAQIAGYCGEEDTLDCALADFAEAYGDQTERDHAALVAAIKAGRVKAVVEGDEDERPPLSPLAQPRPDRVQRRGFRKVRSDAWSIGAHPQLPELVVDSRDEFWR